MKRIRTVLGLAGLILAAVPPPDSAAEPALLVELESVQSLIENITLAGTAMGQQPPSPAMITGGLGAMLKAPGLVGVDTNKPVQLYVFLPEPDDTAKPFDPTAMAPRTAFSLPLLDAAVYASAIGAMFSDSEMLGDVEHLSNAAQPGQELYVLAAGSRATVAKDLETVRQVQKLLGATPEAASVLPFPGTVRMRLDMAACIPFIKAFKGQMPAMIGARPMPPNMPVDPTAILDAEMDALLGLMSEVRSYTLSIQVSASAITLCDRVTPMSGTKTADWILGMKEPASMYMQAIPDNALMASVSSGMRVMDLIAEPYADLMGKIYGAMGAPLNQMGPMMRDMMLSMKGFYSGEFALGIIPTATGEGVGLLELFALADSAKAKKVIEDMCAGLSGNLSKAMPGFTMLDHPPREHNGTEIRGFSYKIEAVTNQPPMPGLPMKWMEGLKWEMAFTNNHLVYTCGPPEIMDGALDRMQAGTTGTPIDKTATFTRLFPTLKGNVVEVHTLSLCGTVKGLLRMVPGVDPALLAAIPDNTDGMAGYSIARNGNLIGVDRISFSEITAIQKAIPALVGSIPALLQQFGMPGKPGCQPEAGAPDALPLPSPPPMQPYEK